MGSLRTLLLVGAPSAVERAAAEHALARAGVDAVPLAVHVTDGHRLAWAECRKGGAAAGLHTYPDLEWLQLVDPETGERGEGRGPRELVLTQLGLRGTALLRWRTADVVDDVSSGVCPACGRTVPRVVGTRRASLVPVLGLRGGEVAVDLRAVAGAVLGRPEVADWRVDITPSSRDGADRLLVHLALRGGVDAAQVALDVADAVETVAGTLPTQVVVPDDGALPARVDGGRLLLRG